MSCVFRKFAFCILHFAFRRVHLVSHTRTCTRMHTRYLSVRVGVVLLARKVFRMLLNKHLSFCIQDNERSSLHSEMQSKEFVDVLKLHLPSIKRWHAQYSAAVFGGKEKKKREEKESKTTMVTMSRDEWLLFLHDMQVTAVDVGALTVFKAKNIFFDVQVSICMQRTRLGIAWHYFSRLSEKAKCGANCAAHEMCWYRV